MAKNDNKPKDEKEIELTSAHEAVKPDEVKIDTDTAVGDVRDALLGRIHNLKKPWEQCTESEQRDIVEQMTKAAEHLVKAVVNAIAADGRTTIVANMHGMKIDKGVLEAKITTKASDENVLMLKGSQQQSILIIAADWENYAGEKSGAEIDPDQPDLESSIAAKASKAKTKAA